MSGYSLSTLVWLSNITGKEFVPQLSEIVLPDYDFEYYMYSKTAFHLILQSCRHDRHKGKTLSVFHAHLVRETNL